MISIINFGKKENNINKKIDLIFIKEFCEKTYALKLKYINKQNLCYAVLLEKITPEGKKSIYLPINYSTYITDAIEITFDAFNRKDHVLNQSIFLEAIKDINTHISKKYCIDKKAELYKYGKIIFDHAIKYAGEVIGASSHKDSEEMQYYFDSFPAELMSSQPINELGLKIKTIAYDYNEINKLIVERKPPIDDKRSQLIGQALYNNYLYQLFVIEFISHLDNERNLEIRKKLTNLIESTSFKKNIKEFVNEYTVILENFPRDIKKFDNQITEFYHFYFNKKTLLNIINTTVYDFDRITINKLQKYDRNSLIVALKTISKKIVIEKDFDSTGVTFPNIYIPCSDMNSNPGYCQDDLLIVNKPLDDFLDLLATDLLDPLKSSYILNNIWVDTTINMFDFIKCSTEIITIYRLT
jgi:hypothetical protein